MNRRRLIVAAALLLVPPSAFAAEAHKKGGGETFIQLTTLTATIFRPNGRRGVMTVEVGIDVPDAGLRTRATQSVPRLQAAFADVLRIYAAGLPPGGEPDPDYLARTLQRQTDATLGRPGAKLLIGTVLVN
jgi:hypothetical protein